MLAYVARSLGRIGLGRIGAEAEEGGIGFHFGPRPLIGNLHAGTCPLRCFEGAANCGGGTERSEGDNY